MNKDDHLDKEVSLSARMTESGIEGKAKSRAVSGIDRLLGNISELANLFLEEKAVGRRSKIEAKREILEAARKSIASKVEDDQDLAEAVIVGDLDKKVRKQQNKIGIAEKAIEIIESDPSRIESGDESDEDISPDFMNRFERLAEDASTEEAKEKWAYVLSGEIRKPGSFSNKALRIIDEIDHSTANAFSEFCKYRLGDVVPKAIFEPEYINREQFIEYDLIVSDNNSVLTSSEAEGSDGEKAFLFSFMKYDAGGYYGVAVKSEGAKEKIESMEDSKIILWNEKTNSPSVPIRVVTSAGSSLMNIMDDRSRDNVIYFLKKLREVFPDAVALEVQKGSDRMKVIDV